MTLLSRQVSRLHAAIVVTATEVQIEDAKSANGTSINGVKLPIGGSAPVTTGDRSRLATWSSPWRFRDTDGHIVLLALLASVANLEAQGRGTIDGVVMGPRDPRSRISRSSSPTRRASTGAQ